MIAFHLSTGARELAAVGLLIFTSLCILVATDHDLFSRDQTAQCEWCHRIKPKSEIFRDSSNRYYCINEDACDRLGAWKEAWK